MVTRRDLIGLAAAGLAGTALESQGVITRSALALRGAMMGGGKSDPYKDLDVTVLRLNVPSGGGAFSATLTRRTGAGGMMIDWGDGFIETQDNNATYSHTYSSGGIFDVVFNYEIRGINMRKGSTVGREFITDCVKFTTSLENFSARECVNLKTIASFAKCPKLTNLYTSFRNDSSLENLPEWPPNISDARYAYADCPNISRVFSVDPNRLMPLTATAFENCVSGSSPYVRSLFLTTWGGTKV